MDDEARRHAGMAIRRRVLGDAHVDAAEAGKTSLTAEFQDLMTRYAWGEIWTRPGLDIHTRRILVLGTLVALGRWEEFELHARAALADDLTAEEIKEVVMQQALYCGIPAAHHAFRIVQRLTASAE